jgi:hypothetical protein
MIDYLINLADYDSYPGLTLDYHDGVWWQECYTKHEGWFPLGIAPLPETTWQTFVYHICHGLIMHYPLISCIAYAWKYRDSFNKETIE